MSAPNPNAFPGAAHLTQPGMTLRDYFAGQAMAAWLSTWTDPDSPHPASHPSLASGLARDAYRVADAMLAARIGASQ